MSFTPRVRYQFATDITTWSNKTLEAGIDLQKSRIFSEKEDSHYANIVAVSSKRAKDPTNKTVFELTDSIED